MTTPLIATSIHCPDCLGRRPPGVTIDVWSTLSVGYTSRGLQVWCRRHRRSVAHIDFEGAAHPADTSRDGSFADAAQLAPAGGGAGGDR